MELRGDVEPSVHGRDTTEVHGRDLTLDEFIDAVTLTAARPSAGSAGPERSVSPERYPAREWLGGLSWSTVR